MRCEKCNTLKNIEQPYSTECDICYGFIYVFKGEVVCEECSEKNNICEICGEEL